MVDVMGSGTKSMPAQPFTSLVLSVAYLNVSLIYYGKSPTSQVNEIKLYTVFRMISNTC